MFKPTTFAGKLFRRYLLTFSHPAKIKIQNIIAKKVFPKGISLKNEDGVFFMLDANDWITRIILKEGNYEQGSVSLAKNILKKGGYFIDIGANFGLFACSVATFNKDTEVIAIEPNYKIIHRLTNNIRLNGLEGKVKIINTAVSKKNQFVSLEQTALDNAGTTVTRINKNAQLSILSCSLEFILREYNCLEIDLVKIDVEGNEFDILQNFPFGDYKIKNIILEFNNLSHLGLKDICLFFEARGFKSYTITGEVLIEEYQKIPENNIWFVNQHAALYK
jgi:FkbM family methyltransferase